MLVAILSLLQRTAAPSLSGALGWACGIFSNWPCRSANMRRLKPSPETNPAVVEIGKRGSAKAASQRADAALPWNTLEEICRIRLGGLERIGLQLRPYVRLIA
jgi:hypothetical protein